MKNETAHHAAQITTSHCSDCGAKGPGVEFHSHGAPILFLCRACTPMTFEKVSRGDIDRWLAGGTV